jgi:ABC-2 type transport system ATP-binding protein
MIFVPAVAARNTKSAADAKRCSRNGKDSMIVARNITKFLGSRRILQDISFHIRPGEIVGLLGQNGAGKTTLMRILSAYFPPSSGTVEIDGADIVRQSFKVRANIGYLPETPPLYPGMTVRDYLRFTARIKDVPVRRITVQVDRVLAECQLEDSRDRVIAVLSKGTRQRVGIAQAIIHEPKLLLLDEPTSGLDPIQILQVRRLIMSLRHERTVLLSTHILPEIEQTAQRVLVIRRGAIVLDGRLPELLGASPEGTTLEDIFIRCHAQDQEVPLE